MPKGKRRKQPDSPRAVARALLRNPTRAEILALVKAHPGINPYQLAGRLGVHPSAVDFHVERLVAAGLFETRAGVDPRERLCFSHEDLGLWEDPSTRVLFGRGAPRDVATYLVEHPGADARQVADALDMSVHTVRRHLHTLVEHDLVERLRIENRVFYHPPDDRLDWLLDTAPGELGSRLDR